MRGKRSAVVTLMLAVGFVLAAVVAGCGSSSSSSASQASSSTASAATSTSSAPIPLAYFAPIENGFVQAALTGAQQGAAATGGKVVQVFAANGSDTDQIKQIEDATSSGKYKGLIVYPLDPSIAKAVEAAAKAGLKVATVEASATPDVMTNTALPGTVISTTEALSYRAQGLVELTVQACAKFNTCNVAFMYGLLQNPSDVGVFNAFQAGLKSHPNIKIVATGQGEFASAPAEAAATNMFQAHPNINVFVTNDDDMTYGVQLAAERAGKAGIKLIGVGASVRGCALVKANKWFGTTNSIPRTAGEQAAKAVDQAISGTYTGPQAWDPLQEQHLPLVTTQANAATCPAQWSS
jgi:ribose transport system substrate-binding protein